MISEAITRRLATLGTGLAAAGLLCWIGSGWAWSAQDEGSLGTETELAAKRAGCASNVRQIALAIRSYAADHDGRLPRVSTWQDDIRPYLRGADVFHCPADPSPGPSSYAYNWMVAGLRLVDIADPAATVVVFESEAGAANQADSAATIPRAPRHGMGNHYGFADGHVELLAKPPNFLPTYAGVPSRGADHKEQIRQLRAMTETLNEKLDAADKLAEEEAKGVDYYQVRQSLERAAQNMDEAYNRLAIVHFQEGASVGAAGAGMSAAGDFVAGMPYVDSLNPTQLINLEIENQQFADVLMRLARQTGAKIVMSPDGIPEGRIYCLLQQVTFEEALARLCEAVGAEYTVAISPVPASEPVYVVRRSDREAGKPADRPTKAVRRGELGQDLLTGEAGTTVLDFTGADFRDVVETLAKRYGFAYQIDAGVPEGMAVTLSPSVRVSGLEAAVEAVAAASGTVWTRVADGTYTIAIKP
jgi:prepilin-type processing-associated H-X9-DG protein